MDGAKFRALGQLEAIKALGEEMQQCRDERQLALLKAARTLVVIGAPPEEIMPLIEFYRELVNGRGKKRRKLSVRCGLASFAEAVTVLKKGRPVDDVIAEVALPNGIDRKELRNLRDRLNRGLADQASVAAYKAALRGFEGMARAEIMSVLARTAKRFCT
jgi:hypothetical protein